MSDWINVADITPRIAYTATAAQTAFTIPFVFFEDTDLKVYRNTVLLTLATHYTVTGAESETGGTLTLLTGATAGDAILITRHVPIEQTTHIPPSGPLDIPAVNVQVSKLIAIDQQLADLFVRSIHLPDGDSTLSAELAPAATRANKLFGFDSNGAVIYPLGPTFVGTTANGVALTDSRATAQVTAFDASVNVINTYGYAAVGDGGGAKYIKAVGTTAGGFQSAGGQWWKLAQMEFLTPQMFGAKTDGTDAAAAMILWAAALGSFSAGLVPAGTYSLASATLGATGLVLPAGATIVGIKGASQFLVTGVAACNLFTATSVSNITIDGLWCYGNGVNGNQLSGTCLIFNLTVGAVAAVKNLRIQNCRFDNFGGDYWINIYNSNTTFAISNIRIQNNDFFSYSGNSRTPSSVGVPADCIAISAQFNENVVTDYWIENNYADCKWIKRFCDSWSGASNGHIRGNTIDNCGVGANIKNVGAYGILCYDGVGTETGRPRNIEIAGNIISNPVSMGIYCVQCKHITIGPNDISGVIDDTPASLLYAAITLADSPNSSITGGNLTSNNIDIQIQGPSSTYASAEGNMTVSNVRTFGGTGLASIRISSAGFTTWTGLTITGCDINHTVMGIAGNCPVTTFGWGDAVIANNRIKAPTGINLNLAATASTSGPIMISGNEIAGSTNGIVSSAALTAGVLNVIGNSFVALASAFQLNLSGVVVNINGNSFSNQTAGQAMSLPGCTGSLFGNNFSNCLAPILPGATQLGNVVPTWSGSVGTFVQSLPPTEQGSAASKYTVIGWVCTGTTTWLPQRALTGN